MALQTREQHIKRGKATSNICTAQALLAVMASMYAVYHGPDGIKRIARHVHGLASTAASHLKNLGYEIGSDSYFDTIWLKNIDAQTIREKAENLGMNFYYKNSNELTISFAEPHSLDDVNNIIHLFAELKSEKIEKFELKESSLDNNLLRKDHILSQDIFNAYHSESKMMRYLKKLENKDLSLVHSMIPLGSCTMKLNAASELIPISNPAFGNLHPFAPISQAQVYCDIFVDLRDYLCVCTGLQEYPYNPIRELKGNMQV